jgi:NACalpha-BTF3-like transcription factor
MQVADPTELEQVEGVIVVTKDLDCFSIENPSVNFTKIMYVATP